MQNTTPEGTETLEKSNFHKATPNLSFGHYKVELSKCIGTELEVSIVDTEQVVCKPLTQEEYAHGWQTALPKPYKGRQHVHHWSVTLAQLPPHLWPKFYSDTKGSVIKDNNYHYSVTPTEHDKVLKALYVELSLNRCARNQVVREYLEQLKGINGWIIIRAQQHLNGHFYRD